MDEFGSALRHSDEPNFRVAPFLFMPEGNLASAVRFPLYFAFQLCAMMLKLHFHDLVLRYLLLYYMIELA